MNEEWLAGGGTLTLPVPAAVHLILLPITGTAEVLLPQQLLPIAVAQVQVLTLPAGSTLQLRNPYHNDVISLLDLWIQATEPGLVVGPASTFSFEGICDRLAPLLTASANLPFTLSLGCFAGRRAATYELPAGSFLAGSSSASC